MGKRSSGYPGLGRRRWSQVKVWPQGCWLVGSPAVIIDPHVWRSSSTFILFYFFYFRFCRTRTVV